MNPADLRQIKADISELTCEEEQQRAAMLSVARRSNPSKADNWTDYSSGQDDDSLAGEVLDDKSESVDSEEGLLVEEQLKLIKPVLMAQQKTGRHTVAVDNDPKTPQYRVMWIPKMIPVKKRYDQTQQLPGGPPPVILQAPDEYNRQRRNDENSSSFPSNSRKHEKQHQQVQRGITKREIKRRVKDRKRRELELTSGKDIPHDEIIVYVELPLGKILGLKLYQDDTPGDLKDLIEEIESIPIYEQLLAFGDEYLPYSDERTLDEIGVEKGSLIKIYAQFLVDEYNDHWERMFESLATFKQAFGHVNVPDTTHDYRMLGHWIIDQRDAFQSFSSKKLDLNERMAERKKLLTDIGVLPNIEINSSENKKLGIVSKEKVKERLRTESVGSISPAKPLQIAPCESTSAEDKIFDKEGETFISEEVNYAVSFPVGLEQEAAESTCDNKDEITYPVDLEQEAAESTYDNVKSDVTPSAASTSMTPETDHIEGEKIPKHNYDFTTVLRPTPDQRLYVSNLYYDWTYEEVRPYFELFGPLLGLTLPMHPDGRNRGFCFVTYMNAEDCSAAKDFCAKCGGSVEMHGWRDVYFHDYCDEGSMNPEEIRRRHYLMRSKGGADDWSDDVFDQRDSNMEFFSCASSQTDDGLEYIEKVENMLNESHPDDRSLRSVTKVDKNKSESDVSKRSKKKRGSIVIEPEEEPGFEQEVQPEVEVEPGQGTGDNDVTQSKEFDERTLNGGKLFLSYLVEGTKEEEIRNFFEKSYGPVESVRLVKDKVTGSLKGFGFADMISRDGALNIMKDAFRNDSMLKMENGLSLRVQVYEPWSVGSSAPNAPQAVASTSEVKSKVSEENKEGRPSMDKGNEKVIHEANEGPNHNKGSDTYKSATNDVASNHKKRPKRASVTQSESNNDVKASNKKSNQKKISKKLTHEALEMQEEAFADRVGDRNIYEEKSEPMNPNSTSSPLLVTAELCADESHKKEITTAAFAEEVIELARSSEKSHHVTMEIETNKGTKIGEGVDKSKPVSFADVIKDGASNEEKNESMKQNSTLPLPLAEAESRADESHTEDVTESVPHVSADNLESLRNSGGELIIKNLRFTWDSGVLRHHFSTFGLVEEVRLAVDRKNKKLNRGFGFVKMATTKDALQVLKHAAESDFNISIKGRKGVVVEIAKCDTQAYSKSKPATIQKEPKKHLIQAKLRDHQQGENNENYKSFSAQIERRFHLRNLPVGANVQGLITCFGRYGGIKVARVNDISGQSGTSGVLEMENQEAARSLLAYLESSGGVVDFNGVSVKVNPEKVKEASSRPSAANISLKLESFPRVVLPESKSSTTAEELEPSPKAALPESKFTSTAEELESSSQAALPESKPSSEQNSLKENMSLKEKLEVADGRLFVGNLCYTFDENIIETHFAKFGPVHSFLLARKKNGKSKGFGFLKMTNIEDALKIATEEKMSINGWKDAVISVFEASQNKVMGSSVDVMIKSDDAEVHNQVAEAKEKFKSDPSLILFNVNGLAENDIDSFFSMFGEVERAVIKKVGTKVRGFVTMKNSDDALKAYAYALHFRGQVSIKAVNTHIDVVKEFPKKDKLPSEKRKQKRERRSSYKSATSVEKSSVPAPKKDTKPVEVKKIDTNKSLVRKELSFAELLAGNSKHQSDSVEKSSVPAPKKDAKPDEVKKNESNKSFVKKEQSFAELLAGNIKQQSDENKK